MAVFKATQNKSDSAGKFKATKNRSYDSALVSGWETSSRDAYKELEKYNRRIISGEYLSSDDLAAYQKALDSYEDAEKNIRRVSMVLGKSGANNNAAWADSVSKMKKNFKGISDYYSHFANADEYTSAKEYATGYKGYMGNATADDYAANSQYVTTRTETAFEDAYWGLDTVRVDTGKLFGDYLYDYINRHEDALGAALVNDTSNKAVVGGFSKNFLQTMTDEEIGVYNYLYKTQGKESAESFLSFIESDLKGRKIAQEQEKWAKYAEEDPFGASVFSVLISPLKGISYVGQAADMLDDGKLEQNAGYNRFSYIPNTIRSQVSQTIENSGNWGKVGSFAYNTGMSMADFLYSTGISGGNQYLSLAIMGSGAAADMTISAKARGLNDGQAFSLGTIAGLAEVAMEKISLSAWLDGDMSEGALRYMLKNSFSEGLEETGTSAINLLADVIIAGDKSEWAMEMQAYIDEGKSPQEAFGLVAANKVAEIGLDALGGFLSGAAISGGSYAGTSAISKYKYGNIANNNAASQELVTEGLELNPDNRYAQKMQSKLGKGKNLSGMQVNNLIQQNENTMRAQDMTTIQTAAESLLTKYGETGDVSAIAAALAKQAAGENLSRSEQHIISNSKYGERVANEMNPDNIKSGGYNSEWAERLDTNRINVEEYSRLVEASQLPQETAETTGEQVVAETQNAVQSQQVEPVDNAAATVPENDQQMTGKLAVEKPLVTEEPESKAVTLEDVSKKYGAQAKAMIHTYQAGQDVAKYDNAYRLAYQWGQSGVSPSYVNKLMNENEELSKSNAITAKVLRYLTKEQVELAYAAGEATADTNAKTKEAENRAAANGMSVRREGVVRVDGVTVKNLDELRATLNDTQKLAYKFLSDVSKSTGIDIVLYRSKVGPDGRFLDEKGKEAAQGYYRGSEEPGTIYIDLNAGLENVNDVNKLHRYAMLRTFAHEFTHFIEKWNPVQYNEFRKIVFEAQESRSVNVHERIVAKQNNGMTYDDASREVVAESMTDILPDSNFVQELAEKHRNIFQWLLDKLKEFVENLKTYYRTVGGSYYQGATALKEQVGDTVKYLDSIVQMFDKVAVQAVENYQQTVATEEVAVAKNETNTAVSETKVVESKTKVVESKTKVVESKTKVEETTPATVTENATTISDAYGFTISDNVEHGSLEITFDSKPSETVRDVLKENKFRWHKAKNVWYGYADRADITEALHAAYETEAAASTVTENSAFENAFWDATQEERDEVVDAIHQNTKITHLAPTEIRENADVVKNEEVTENDQNADNTGAAQPSEPDGRGAAQVLDELQTGDVQGDGDSGDTVADLGERGQSTVRDGGRSDAQGSGRGSGEGSSQSGDLRRNDGLTAEGSADTDSEQLHDEVVQQIAQQSTEKPKGRNFVIGDSLNLPSGEKARYKANVEAIRLVKQLEAEGRYATEAEQVILSKYVGWGGLANAFDQRKTEWSKEFAELKGLLTDEEYNSARGSTLNAHYTDISVIKAMYDGLKQLGFTGGRMMEPSSGVGNFVGAMPADMASQVRSWTMVELDGITGLIAKYLYPNADVRIQGFEKAKIPDNFMDVAISNVPFGNYAIADKSYPKKVTSAIHNYFFAKSLDKVRPGGIVMFITSSYTMNSSDSTVRRYIMQKADLLGAIRLPDSAFKSNAGTEVVTDILVLKKRAENTAYAGEEFLEAPYQYVDGFYSGAYINKYFLDHPEMVLGKATMTGGMYRADSLTYKAFTDRGSLADQIREAFKSIHGKMEYPAQRSPEKTNFAVERAGKKTKENGLVVKDGKQSFINQVMNGENVGRETEDTGEVTLSAAEVKALASGSPLIMEQVQLDTDIKKLESLRRAHRSAVTNAISRLEADKGRIALLEKMIENGKVDTAARVDTYSDGNFSITIGKHKFFDKKDAGTALMAEATAKANEDGYTTIAQFAGFDLRVVKTHEGIKGMISGKQSYSFNTYPGNTTYMINHLIARVEEISEAVTQWERELVQTRKDMVEQEKLITQPFAKQAELDQKRARYNEVMEILNPKEEQALDTVAEDDVQYQSRDYYEGWNSYELSDEFLREVSYADRDSFLRSLANQTVGIKEGETRHIAITTGSMAYFFNATGYMNGSIEKKVHITSKNQARLKTLRKEYINETDTGRETFSQMAQGYEMQRGRDGWDYDAAGYSGVSGRNDDVDVEASGSDTFGSYWDNYGYSSWEELREAVASGAMIMDENGDLITFEQLQQRTNPLTDRDVLMLAYSEVETGDWSSAEKEALGILGKRLSKLESLQAERTELGRLYREQQFGPNVDRKAAEETLNRMRVLDGQIQRASADVLDIENKEVLRRVLKKARTVVEQQDRQHFQEVMKRKIDRMHNSAAIKKYRDRIRGDVDELTNWVLHPDNKNVVKHIPDALKNTVIPFLSSINFMSKRSLGGGNHTASDKAFMEQLRRLEKVMDNTTEVDEMYANYTDLPPDFMKNLHRFIDTAQGIVDSNSGDFIINQMTSEELQELSKVVRTLKKYIMQMNRFHVNAMFQHVDEAGENSIDFLEPLKPAENTGAVSQFLLWQQMRPAYAFERFGEGGMAIYDGLRRGQATLAFNTKKIKAFSDKTYTAAEVRAWENHVKTIRIGPEKTVTMRVSQIMSLYELNKRKQAQGHILGEGIRVATFKHGKQKISDVGQRLTPGELNLILRELTPRQKEVADQLQQFMEKQGGEWGNYVTVARFGEKQFGEENYFPINSDGRHLQVDADEKPGAASLYALLNMGFTKQTQEKAKNRVVVYSIFDVFANHMASMAQYNAFALPVVDALKWFNYQRVFIDENGSKTILGSVREQMDRAYGVPEESKPGSGRRGYAQSFIINIIKALNGTEAQGTPNDTWGLQTLHHYNRAQVAYNFRVVVQQPLAITRAAMLLDYRSIMKGMKLAPAAIQKNVQEMQKYSGIAAWKSLGFYDVNISRGLTSIIKHDDTALDKVTDVGMWGAEKADLWTWAAIWSAAKEEVIRKQKLTPNSEGFYEAVTKLFEDVIYKTQVVDSVLTKNEFMRDKGFFARAVGSFMSEPSTTASMLLDAYDKFHMDMQRGMNRQQAWKKNRHMIVRTAYVYGIGALVLAAVQAAADGLRDDDDYQEFYEKWLEAFDGNLLDELMPFNKLPIASDFYDLAKELLSIVGVDTYGNPPQSVFMQWYDSLVKGVDILYDKVSGDNTNYTWYGGAYRLLQALSGMTGLPMAAATREIVTAWNNTIGAMAPSLKVKTYELSDKSQIKYAYQDGYLTEDEAIEQLIEKGIAKNEHQARKIMKDW